MYSIIQTKLRNMVWSTYGHYDFITQMNAQNKLFCFEMWYGYWSSTILVKAIIFQWIVNFMILSLLLTCFLSWLITPIYGFSMNFPSWILAIVSLSYVIKCLTKCSLPFTYRHISVSWLNCILVILLTEQVSPM